MRLSEKQAQMLFTILQESLCITGHFMFDAETRKQLAEDILNQQSKELKELEKEGLK